MHDYNPVLIHECLIKLSRVINLSGKCLITEYEDKDVELFKSTNSGNYQTFTENFY